MGGGKGGRVARKGAFWRILKTALIFKAISYIFNLDF